MQLLIDVHGNPYSKQCADICHAIYFFILLNDCRGLQREAGFLKGAERGFKRCSCNAFNETTEFIYSYFHIQSAAIPRRWAWCSSACCTQMLQRGGFCNVQHLHHWSAKLKRFIQRHRVVRSTPSSLATWLRLPLCRASSSAIVSRVSCPWGEDRSEERR